MFQKGLRAKHPDQGVDRVDSENKRIYKTSQGAVLEQKKFCQKKKTVRDGLPDLAAAGSLSLSDLLEMKQGFGFRKRSRP